ncbi:MAG TPA: hypothetical protein VHT53_06615 [Candidatus Elarobacter sp.]|jgi:hypothetical protein|nr:hypothetical protein [Candidatus Elarobacter sp.]
MITSRKSRYAGTPAAVLIEDDGSRVHYLRRRFLPASDDVTELTRIDPDRAGMRLDLLAARLIGDSEQFWRLLDANDGENPFDFIDETAGRPLRIPHPAASP